MILLSNISESAVNCIQHDRFRSLTRFGEINCYSLYLTLCRCVRYNIGLWNCVHLDTILIKYMIFGRVIAENTGRDTLKGILKTCISRKYPPPLAKKPTTPMIYYLLNYSKYHWEQLIKKIVQVYYIFHQYSVFNRMSFHFHNGTLMVFDDQIAPFPTKVRDTKLIHTVILYNEKIFFFSNSQKPYIIHLYIYIYS